MVKYCLNIKHTIRCILYINKYQAKRITIHLCLAFQIYELNDFLYNENKNFKVKVD